MRLFARWTRHIGRRLGPGLCAAAVLAGPAEAAADSLQIDLQANPERGFQVIQELSYEAIVVGTDGYRADLRLRVALHNASNREQDTVLSLALPRGAEIHGLQIARDGVWTPGKAAGISPEPGRREPGSVYVRPLAPVAEGDLPGAEIVAFSLEPATTTQVELILKVPIRLRGDRWELELPGRGDDRDALAPERRVLVKSASADPNKPGDRPSDKPPVIPQFWVDGSSNAGQPYLVTQPEDRTLVAWPIEQDAKASRAHQPRPLDAHLAVFPDAPKSRTGRFRLTLRLGPAAPPRPDHVVVLVDRSRSTSPAMHREAIAAVGGLFDALPAGLTFDAISFARKPRALLPEGAAWPGVHDRVARERIAATLDAGSREQGTDLSAALALAGQRIAARGAKRPLVLVITDGMLPLGAGAGPIGQVFADSLGKARRGERPELIFLVDEPMLGRTGIAADHPIAQLAAGLDARISLATLAQYGRPDEASGEALARNLLRAPGVLRELEVTLPSQAVLEDSPPAGLVAGNVVVLAGSYTKGPPAVRVRGKLGEARAQLQPRPEVWTAPPTALVAALRPTGPAQAAAEGFAVPPWYGRKHQRTARLGISWAGRSRGDDRGHLDEKIFRRYLGTRVFPRARVCYNQALTKNQVIGGRVVFEFEVGKGEVMRATTDVTKLNEHDLVFERCLLEAAWMLDIPAGKLDDQIYRVRYPLVFNPPRTGRPTMDEDSLGAGTVELLLNLGR